MKLNQLTASKFTKSNKGTFNILRILPLLCFCLMGLSLINSPTVKAQENILVDKIIGIVGDKIVLESDIATQFQQAKLQGVPTEGLDCQILEQLMFERLLINQAELDSIMVSEDEIEIELDNRFRYYISLLGSEEKFEEYFGKSILEFKDEFRKEIKDILLAQRMQETITANIHITPAEVEEFFNEIPQDSLPYFNAEIEIAEIVLNPTITKEAKEEAKTFLRSLKDRIESGENTFEELAKGHSDDLGSAAQGGILGFQDRGTFVSEFEAVAYKLKKDEISGLVETEYGFHLLKLLERRGNRINVQHILIKPKVSQADLDLTASRADSIRSLVLTDSLNFREAVDQFSEDENSVAIGGLMVNQTSGTTFFEMDQVSPDIFFSVESLKEGEMSVPTLVTAPDGSKQYKVFRIESRSEPHQANLKDDYNRIQNFTEQQKQAEIMSSWISDKVAKTYIRLDDKYTDCESMLKWLP